VQVETGGVDDATSADTGDAGEDEAGACAVCIRTGGVARELLMAS
jgi:hypothetical protein